MTIDQLRTYREAQSFQPFIMHLADGREIRVHHREFIMPSPSGRTVLVYQPDDTLNVVDLLLVTGLEIRSPRNGSKKRRSA